MQIYDKFVIVLGIFIVFSFLAFSITVYEVKNENKKLKNKILKLDEELEKNNNFLLSEFSSVYIELNKINEHVSVIDASIDPKDKRWAKIKQIRKTIQDTIENNGYVKSKITDLTTISSAIVDFSEQYDVSVSLILAVMRRESAFVRKAVSHAGAKGLMQLMPATAKECADDVDKRYYSIFKIRDNIQLGTWYLWKMLDIFNGDFDLAIRAYNAGPTYVQRVLAGEYKDYPKETREYSKIVLEWKKEYEDLGL